MSARERCDYPRDRRVARDRAEHRRLGADRGHIGQTVTPQSGSGRDVEQHLPGVVDRPSRPPRRKRRGQLTPQTGKPRRCHHQQGSRGGDQRLASTIKTQTRSMDTLHLRSAFPLGPLDDFAIPSFPCWTGTSVLSPASVAGRLTKSRG